MTPERWQQVKAAFDDVQASLPGDREARLEQMLARDPEMHRDVVALLQADASAGGFLERAPLTEADRAIADRQGLPSRIGPYRIVREIGRGGMGIVLLGARDDAAYQKEVAIKVMRSRADAGLLRRFTDERRILAQLVHPNIAALLDGGSTEQGDPFLVMEYVAGRPIDSYCDERPLAINDRLRLFLQVCSAVQHAHQRLVVHRDIKPANILVTPGGTPKLLDFGIAKILAADESAGGTATVTMAQLLTPEFASPEQVRGEPITVATDVYALGVVLYRLLTGARPYGGAATDRPHDLARAICEDDPVRPSVAAPQLGRTLAGDLDTVVLKALQKDPARRYSSAEAFADDVERYLDGRPVRAHADSTAYRTAKFVRRHRIGVAAAAALVIAIVAGSAATFWQWRVAEANRVIAERRFNDVRTLARSVVFEIHDAVADLPGATKARALIVQKGLDYLDAAGREAAGDRDLQLEVAAAFERISEIQANLGSANLGEGKAALVSAEKALALRRSVALVHPDHVPALRALATSLRQMAYLKIGTPEGMASIVEAVTRRERIAGMTGDPEDAQRLAAAHHAYGQHLSGAHRPDEALREYERARAGYQTLLAAEPGRLSALGGLSLLMKNTGALQQVQNRLDQALASYQRALELDEARLAKEPDSVQAKMNKTFSLASIAGALGALGRTREAIEYHRGALAIREGLWTLDPANVAARTSVVRTYQAIGYAQVATDPAGALATFQHALRIIESGPTRTRELDASAAWIHAGTGDAHVAALKAGVSRAVRADLYRRARASYERSRAAFVDLRTGGSLPPPDASALERVTAGIQAVQTELARLAPR